MHSESGFIMGKEVNLFCIYGRHSVDLKAEIFPRSHLFGRHHITFSFLSLVPDTPLTIPPFYQITIPWPARTWDF